MYVCPYGEIICHTIRALSVAQEHKQYRTVRIVSYVQLRWQLVFRRAVVPHTVLEIGVLAPNQPPKSNL